MRAKADFQISTLLLLGGVNSTALNIWMPYWIAKTVKRNKKTPMSDQLSSCVRTLDQTGHVRIEEMMIKKRFPELANI